LYGSVRLYGEKFLPWVDIFDRGSLSSVAAVTNFSSCVRGECAGPLVAVCPVAWGLV
jgi:hypothetical protein